MQMLYEKKSRSIKSNYVFILYYLVKYSSEKAMSVAIQTAPKARKNKVPQKKREDTN